MNREEFEARMGNRVDVEVWDAFLGPMATISREAGLSDDAVVDDYKVHGHSRILRALVPYAVDAMARAMCQEAENKDVRERVDLASKLLLHLADQVPEDGDRKLAVRARQVAHENMGDREAITYKVMNGLRLTPYDQEYILRRIGGKEDGR